MEIDISKIINPIINEIRDVARITAKREIYPEKIRGNILAAKLLDITPNALKQRVHRGFYREDYHFKKKSDRIYEWNRDALLDTME